jgi:putative transposase
MITTSDNEVISNLRIYDKYLPKLRRLDKKMARQCYGSQRREKTIVRLQRLHEKIANIRSDYTHKITKSLSQKYYTVVMETLAVKSMQSTRKLSRQLNDVNFMEVRRQLTYKCHRTVLVDQYFPSTRQCSCCGNIKKNISLSTRVYQCNNCEQVIDRDYNAALNILNEGKRLMAKN